MGKANKWVEVLIEELGTEPHSKQEVLKAIAKAKRTLDATNINKTFNNLKELRLIEFTEQGLVLKVGEIKEILGLESDNNDKSD